MSTKPKSDVPPLGLLELDPAGVVVRYAPVAEQGWRRRDVLGRNFFTEVMPAERLYGFRARFLNFMAGGQAVDKFALSIPRAEGALKVQVVLTAANEGTAGRRERLALVRIMPEETRAAA
jgi:hypothetical protein